MSPGSPEDAKAGDAQRPALTRSDDRGNFPVSMNKREAIYLT
jgi:hypothetical protein